MDRSAAWRNGTYHEVIIACRCRQPILHFVSEMERIRKALKGRSSVPYEPLATTVSENEHSSPQSRRPFSWLEYSVFFLLGMSMLWAW